MGRLRGKSSGSAAVDAARKKRIDREARRLATAVSPPKLRMPSGGELRQNAAVTDALMATLERQYASAMRRAVLGADRDELQSRWRPWEGTPETNERIARVPSRRRQSPLDRMKALGTITDDEHSAAEEIVRAAEMIQRRIGSASLEARVDYQNSARDALIESLGRIRAEVAYTAWRDAIPQPRALILDMLLTNMGYVKLARLHGLHWRTARRLLLTALRMWPEYRIAARHSVTEATVHEVYQRLGEGTLVMPKPKAEMAALNEDAAR